MEIFIKETIKIINFREKALIFGKVGLRILDSSRMEKGMDMEFGDQARKIMTYMKVSMLMIISMEMAFTNGLMEQFIKVRLKMI